MLFIDDCQPQFVEADLLLKQRVRADGKQRFARSDFV